MVGDSDRLATPLKARKRVLSVLPEQAHSRSWLHEQGSASFDIRIDILRTYPTYAPGPNSPPRALSQNLGPSTTLNIWECDASVGVASHPFSFLFFSF